MRRILVGLVFAVIVFPAWAQTRAENRAKCVSDNPDISISGCTADIQSGQEEETVLPVAYLNRGHSYFKKGLYDKAIPDLTKAIATLPSKGSRYYNYADTFRAHYFRGFSYEKKHQRNNAIADYRVAQKLDPGNKDLLAAFKRINVANSCTSRTAITLNGTITKTERSNGVQGIFLYVDDPSLDCRPIRVLTDPYNKCSVGETVSATGELAQLPGGSGWDLVSGDYMPVILSSEIKCSKK